MNAAVHVMCFYYSSWNDKIYANITISKVGKTWLSALRPYIRFQLSARLTQAARTRDFYSPDTTGNKQVNSLLR